MIPTTRNLLVTAMVVLAAAIAPLVSPGWSVHARSGYPLLPVLLPIIVMARRRDLTDGGPAASLVGSAGAGIIAVAAFRLLLQTGLGPGATLPVTLLLIAIPPALTRRRFLGGALLFLPLTLLCEPAAAFLLPQRLVNLDDPFHLLLRNLASGSLLAVAIGLTCLRAGISRTASAGGFALGSVFALACLDASRWPEAITASLALMAFAGSLELARRALAPGPRVRGLRAALPLAPLAALVPMLRLLFPASAGIAPASFDRGDLSYERHYQAEETLVLARRGRRHAGALSTSLGNFTLRPGDLDIFAGTSLAVAYAPRAHTALLVGVYPASEYTTLASAGRLTRIDTARPSLLPWGPPLVGSGDPGQRYDVIVANVTSAGVVSVLPALRDALAPGGLVAIRRLGPAWEEVSGLRDFVGTFEHHVTFWDHERSGVTLVSDEILTFSSDLAKLASLSIARRYPILHDHGLVPSGAWLAPPDGRPPSAAVRTDMAMLHLASGSPFDANVDLGVPTAIPDTRELALRALVQFAMHDPTGERRDRSFARRAIGRDPDNPFMRQVARTVGVPEPPARGEGPPIELALRGHEIPGWLLLGPLPAYRWPGGPDPLTIGIDAAIETSPAGVPFAGQRVGLELGQQLSWVPWVAHGHVPTRSPLAVPFDVLAPSPYPASLYAAFTEIHVESPAFLDVAARRRVRLTIDDEPRSLTAAQRVPLAAGRHRIMIETVAARGEPPAVTLRLEGVDRPSTCQLRVAPGQRTESDIVEAGLAAHVSACRLRAAPGPLLLIELPPIAQAIESLEVRAGGIEVPLAWAIELDDPGRFLLPLPAIAVGSLIEVETCVGDVAVSRRLTGPSPAATSLLLMLTSRTELRAADQATATATQARVIDAALAAVRATATNSEGERYVFAIESAITLAAFSADASGDAWVALEQAFESGTVEAPGVEAQLERSLLPPALWLAELAQARRTCQELGATPRTAILSDPGGLSLAAADLLSASGIDLVLLAERQRSLAPGPRVRVGPSGRTTVVATPALGLDDGSRLLIGDPSARIALVDEALRAAARALPPPFVLVAPINAAPPLDLARSVIDWNATFDAPRLTLATPAEYRAQLAAGASAPTMTARLGAPRDRALAANPRQVAAARRAFGWGAATAVAARALDLDGAGPGLDGDLILRAEHARLARVEPPATDSSTPFHAAVCRHIGERLAAGSSYVVAPNPLPYRRREPVRVAGRPAEARRFGGQPDRDGFVLVADVPATGYLALPADAPPPARAPTLELDLPGGRLSNRFYQIEFDPDGGALRSLRARESGVELFPAGPTPPLSVTFDLSPGAAAQAGSPSVSAHPAGNVEGTIGPVFGSLTFPLTLADAATPIGTLRLTLHEGVRSVDVDVEITAPVPAGTRARLELPLAGHDGPIVVEEALSERRLAPAAGLAAMRGGFSLTANGARIAVASPDAPLLVPEPLSVVLFDATPGYPRPLRFHFAITSGPSLARSWSPHGFYRSVELPMSGCIVTPPPHELTSAALEMSYLQVQPETVELYSGTEESAAPGHAMDIIVRNAASHAVQQKLIFPVHGTYMVFPLAANQIVELEIDPDGNEASGGAADR